MENQFHPLDSPSEENDIAVLFSETGSIFKIGEFLSAIKKVFQVKGLGILRDRLSSKGRIPDNVHILSEHGWGCEILKPGAQSWQKGKVRIKFILEYCPDEPEDTETPENNQPKTNQPESPLDDLRRMING
jgi:hypothetical protein